MKTFGELNPGDKLVLIHKYDINSVPDTIYEVKEIITYQAGIHIDIVIDSEWEYRKNIKRVNIADMSITYTVNVKHLLTPIENYKYIQGIYNMGYIIGKEDAQTKIKQALGIYN